MPRKHERPSDARARKQAPSLSAPSTGLELPARLSPLLALALILCDSLAVAASASASPPTATTEPATAVAYTEAVLKGAVNPEGSETTYWFEYGETTAYGTKVPVPAKSAGSGTSKVPVRQLINELKENTEYHFRIVAEGEGKTVQGEDATFTTCGFNFSFPEEGSKSWPLSEPFDLDTDLKGNIWISDTGNDRIVEFDEKGEYVREFGKEGSGKGEFKSPKGVAIDSSDNVWVVDSGNNRVQKFNSKGEWLSEFGKEGAGEAQFKSPSGIATVGSGPNLFVADTDNNRVQKLNSSGKWLATIGKEGSGDGEFKSPEGIGLDAKDRIWVADTGNNRIQKFNTSTFKFVSKFGEVGTGNGQFKSPIGIVNDFQEKLWVVDSGNDRAQKFDIEGNYLDKVGKEGTGQGQLIEPTGIVAPSPQKVVILDAGNDQGDIWTVRAEPPKATTNLADEKHPTSITLNANLNPRGLTTEYWFEFGETEAYGQKIPASPESIGSGLDNVLVAQKVTGLKEGTSYHFKVVAESIAGRSEGIDRVAKTGKQPKAITDPATSIKTTEAALNGLVNPEGSATSYWFEYGETTAYGTKIPISPASVGSGTSFVEVSQTPAGLKEGKTYHFQVVAETEPGHPIPGGDKSFTTLKVPDVVTEAATEIKKSKATLNGKVNPLGSSTNYWFEYGETTSYGTKVPIPSAAAGAGSEYISAGQTLSGLYDGTLYHFRLAAESTAGKVTGEDKTFTTSSPSFSLAFGSEGSGNGQFLHPAESAVDSEGNVWVADMENYRVQEFDGEGKYLSQIKGGKCPPQRPKSLAIGAAGHIWVDSSNENEIHEYDTEGNCLLRFGERGSEPGKFEGPESMAIDAEGDIWVADTRNGRLQEFDHEGELLQVVSSYGSEPGQLGEPTGIDIGPEGNIWVADWQNKRVAEFNAAGGFIRQFGELGTGNGQFNKPDSIEVDEAGNVWVLDEGNKRIQHFDEEGKYLGKFGSSGSGEGQFNFGWPAGITSDAEGNLWIADSLNHRIQKWIP